MPISRYHRRLALQLRKEIKLTATAAIPIGTVLLILVLLMRTVGVVRNHSPLDSRNFGQAVFSRQPGLSALEQYLRESQLKPCDGDTPLFSWMPAQACRPIDCLFSSKRHVNIDLNLFPWTILRPGDVPNHHHCPHAIRGQDGDLGIPAQVSFIMTVTNNEKLARQVVLELFRTSVEVGSVEFVVVDDRSESELSNLHADLEAMNYYFGVSYKYRRNKVAVGYGEANNKAVKLASGEYIVIINSDLYPTRGWLSNLLHTLQTYPNAGQVGPVFFGENHIIQEAGSIIWGDATAYNARGGEEPNHFYLHTRPVDYISAACVVTKKALFLELGGFKKKYGLGYYEDTDLSSQACGAATVCHGVPPQGKHQAQDDLMAKNRELFYKEWQDNLRAHCRVSDGPFIGSHRLRYPNILLVDSTAPTPDRDSGSVRMDLIIEALLAENLNVAFQAIDWVPRKYEAALAERGVMVMPYGKEFGWIAPNGACMFGTILIARRPVFETSIVLERFKTISGLCPNAKIIFDTVDLHFLREARDAFGFNVGEWNFVDLKVDKIWSWIDTAENAYGIEDIRRSREIELKCIDASTTTIVVSHSEARLLKMIRPNTNPAFVSNMYKLPAAPVPWTKEDCAKRDGIIFIGNMNHTPNKRALDILTRDILPIVNEKLGSKAPVLHIVGSQVLQKLKFEKIFKLNIVYHFSLSDEELERLYRRMRVSVAPLMSAAGVKGKVAQALLFGVPVVVTPIAAEGMQLVHGQSCLIGRNPEEFANNIIRVFQDCSLCNQVRKNGFNAIEQSFSFDEGRRNISMVWKAQGSFH